MTFSDRVTDLINLFLLPEKNNQGTEDKPNMHPIVFQNDKQGGPNW